MDQAPENSAETIFDASPYLKLIIDKDGRWYQNGAEIIHQGIYKLFCDLLEKTAEGGYLIRMGREICSVEVEDAPFVVVRLVEGAQGRVSIELNDGSSEQFDPQGFWIGAQNVPYCTVKAGRFHARFSRPAYYQIAKYVESEDGETEFHITINGVRTAVRKRC